MKQKNFVLIFAEILVIGGILFAFISPLFSTAEEEETGVRLVLKSQDFA
jgi:hypothetical protein